MLVTHILNHVRPSGAESMLLEAVPYFREHDIETTIIATGRLDPAMVGRFRAYGVVVHQLPYAERPSFLRSLRRLTRGADVVQIHTERASFWMSLAVRRHANAVIRVLHGVFPFEGNLRWRRALQRRIATWLGVQYVAVSGTVADNERERFGARPRLIPNFVSPRFDVQQGPTYDNHGLLIVSVGNCSSIKNHDLVLRAIHELQTNGIPATYIHIGDETDGGPAERALAQALGIETSVTFAGSTDPLPALRGASVFVMPSRSEGLGIAALEAMAVGLPVVLADSPGLREFKSIPGLWWCQPEAEDLARAIAEVFATPAGERAARSATARGEVLRRFSRDASLDAWIALYRGGANR